MQWTACQSVMEMICLLSEKSIHTPRDEGKLFNSAWLTGASGQLRVDPQQKILPAYIHLRLMHFALAAILKYLSGPNPRLHFKSFKQRQETASLAA